MSLTGISPAWPGILKIHLKQIWKVKSEKQSIITPYIDTSELQRATFQILSALN
jgi:hypothetical protein